MGGSFQLVVGVRSLLKGYPRLARALRAGRSRLPRVRVHLLSAFFLSSISGFRFCTTMHTRAADNTGDFFFNVFFCLFHSVVRSITVCACFLFLLLLRFTCLFWLDLSAYFFFVCVLLSSARVLSCQDSLVWQLPEHLIEDILELILFLTNHHPATLGTSQLYPLMTMVRERGGRYTKG